MNDILDTSLMHPRDQIALIISRIYKRVLQTFDRLEVAEFSAKSLVLAKPLGSLIPINNKQVEDFRRVFLKK